MASAVILAAWLRQALCDLRDWNYLFHHYSASAPWELSAFSSTGARNESAFSWEILVIRITNLEEEEQGKEV